uniref:Si:ch73-130a3.4 n=1 Tax=Sinocyclocheilus rhinocerous TaxID=307959 RepID=A0A673FP20_9TELE
MPDSCAAWGCKNRRTIQSRYRGITFHKFPREKALRRQWEIATRRKGFSASDCSVLCSDHFKPQDVDRTGQIVRIREGAKPSVFSFPAHLQRVGLPLYYTIGIDHSYALPADPTDLKARLGEALARVESLERDMRNVKKREQRAKNMVLALLEDLNGKNFINDELKHKLNFYSGKMKIKS